LLTQGRRKKKPCFRSGSRLFVVIEYNLQVAFFSQLNFFIEDERKAFCFEIFRVTNVVELARIEPMTSIVKVNKIYCLILNEVVNRVIVFGTFELKRIDFYNIGANKKQRFRFLLHTINCSEKLIVR